MDPSSPARWRIEVAGVVQGVGFRPYVYQLASAEALVGYVCNRNGGVSIEVQGAAAALERFLDRLRRHPPPLARIAAVHIQPVAVRPEPALRGGGEGFAIRPSRTEGDGAGLELGPDTALCDACRAEFLGPSRRQGYAFTSCTDCGPRYTITTALPFDRARTTMAGFALCPACQREHDTPADRRFHAQANACPQCGPQLALGEARGPAALEQARARLRQGQIVAIKNVGGYQLGCDARQPEAVERLRRRKRRGDKPFALLAGTMATVEAWCEVTATERASLLRPARPIVLLKRRTETAALEAVAPGQPRLGIMLPSSPLQELLVAPPLDLLVMTSGNQAGQPMAQTAAEARAQMGAIADAFLDHDRGIVTRADDSIVFCHGGRERLLRRARGYVPEGIGIGRGRGRGGVILAAGGEMKNAFCLLERERAQMSPHLGEMESLEAAAAWEQTLAHMLRLRGLRLEEMAALAYDPHPGYRISQRARRLPIARQLAVQHHHAHIASCMAEHGLTGAVLGVAWDGTGWGADETIWGGEFLLVEARRFHRAAHLRPVAIVGGDGAVRHPWRLGLAYLADAIGSDQAVAAAQWLWPARPGMAIGDDDIARLGGVLAGGRMGRRCSSAGRLFDAVAALLGLHAEAISFEAQAAMALEAAAERGGGTGPPYDFHLSTTAPAVFDLRPMLEEIWMDLRQGRGIEPVAARFHRTLAAVVVAGCKRMREQYGERRVCLGGGTFQNRRLLALVETGLQAAGFAVYLPARVPANDGGLALGQAVVARARLRAGAEGSPEAAEEDGDVFGHTGQDRAVV